MVLEKLISVNLNFATISMREDGIINTNILIDDPVNIEQAKELLNAYINVSKGVKTPNLYTVSKFALMEKEVMEFIINEANQHGKADAFVIHSLPQKILANFYLKFIKPNVPTKFFRTEEKAIEWLNQYK